MYAGRMFDRKPPLVSSVTFDGHEFALCIEYHPALPARLKELRGSFVSWKGHALAKAWRFAPSQARALTSEVSDLVARCGGKFHETPTTFERKLLQAEQSPRPGVLVGDSVITLYRYERPCGGGSEESRETEMETGVIAMAPYHRGFNSTCAKSDGHWQPGLKGWVIPGADPESVRYNLSSQLRWPAAQIEIMDGIYKLQTNTSRGSADSGLDWRNLSPDRAANSEQSAYDGHVVLLPAMPLRAAAPIPRQHVDAALPRYQLDEYQNEGVRHLLASSSSLLADDMGLGKTRQSIVAADIARAGGQVLVICPASLLGNWAAEIKMVKPDARISTRTYDASAEWVVTNYEQVQKLIDIAGRFAVAILDEAHLIRNPAAAITRETFKVTARIRNRMVLTGTPLLNSISEVHTLLRLSGHPLGEPGYTEFARLYGGADGLAGLHRQLNGWMLRREKESVLSLRGKQRTFERFALDAIQSQEHREIMMDASIEAYVKITRLRQGLERWKVPYLSHLRSLMGRDDKLIVFCAYTDTVQNVLRWAQLAGIGAIGITGATAPTARSAAVREFQSDPDLTVFVGTTDVAGVGLTLTAANWVTFLGLPWTWGILEQAEDRAYRRGQQRPVYCRSPIVENSIDTHILSIISDKRDVGERVVKGRVADMLDMALAA